jgi:hypothetical protein
MNWLALSCILIAITCASLGTFVFLRNPKGRINQTFFGLNVVTIWWTVGITLVLISKDYATALFWGRTLQIGVVLIPFLYYHFMMELLGLTQLKKKIILAGYFLGGLFVISTFTPLFIPGMQHIPELNLRYYIIPGPFYHAFLVAFATFPTSAIVLAVKRLRVLQGMRRNQIKYAIVASLLAFIGGSTTYFPAYGVKIYPWANFLVALYPPITAYAIVRYRLMDINIAIVRGATFLFVYVPLLFLPIIGGAILRTALERWLGFNWWILPALLAAVLAVGGLWVYRWMTRQAEERILAEQREYQALLLEAAQGMLDVLNPYQLIDLIAKVVMRHVKVSHVAVYYQERRGMPYHLKSFERSVDWAGEVEPLTVMDSEDRLIAYLEAVREPILVEELVRAYQEGRASHLGSMLAHLRDLKAALVVPSFLRKRRLVGFLLLGAKRSGEPFSFDDLKIFKILADQAAIAIQHARFYTRSLTSEMFQGLKELLSSNAHEIHNILHRVGMVLAPFSLYPERALPAEKVREVYLHAVEVLEQGRQWTEEIKRYEALMKDAGVKAYAPYRQLFLPLLDLPKRALSERQFPKERIERIRVVLDCPQDLPKIEGLPTLPDLFRHLVLNACWSMADRCPDGGTIVLKASCPDRKSLQVHLTDPGELLLPLLQNPEHYAGGFYLPQRGKLGAVHLFLARLIVLEHSGNLEISVTEDGKENLVVIQLPLTFIPPPLKDDEGDGDEAEVG